MNIVLDMDQTLIDEDENDTVYPRPHLKAFLQFCFHVFDTVSIWTNASQGWFDIVNTEIFEPILSEINVENETNHKFYVTYTEKRSTTRYRKGGGLGYVMGAYKIKPLRKLWRQKSTPHTKHNTIIIDDTCWTYKENYGNGIPIRAWSHRSVFDKELLQLAQYLDQVLLPKFGEQQTIRYVEKRWWKDDI